jgi:outer-membrane receptor for ferric coprogen and ferric-rhodotorulic acid
LDAAFTHQDYFYESANLERKNLFAVLEYDVTPSTLLTIGGSYAWTNSLPFIGGLPAFPDGSDAHLPRGTAFTFPWSYYQTQNREIYVHIQQGFGSAWRLRVNTAYLGESDNYAIGQFSAAVNPTTRELAGAPYGATSIGPSLQSQPSVDATLTGNSEWLDRHIEVAIGADYLHFHQHEPYLYLNPFGPASADPYHFDPGEFPDPVPRVVPLYAVIDNWSIQAGLYASLKLQLSSRWSLTAGLRMSRESDTSKASIVSPAFSGAISESRTYSNPTKLTPYVGVMYTLSSVYSLYASYADIEQSNNGMAEPNGKILAPEDGIDIEAGTKAAWRDGALNATLSIYKIIQRGVATVDTDVPSLMFVDGCCYLPGGKRLAAGLDLQIRGAVAPGWLVGAGYTYNNNRDRVSGPFYDLALSGQTPRHLLKIWSSTRLPGALSRWTVGGTLQAQSANSSLGYGCAAASCGALQYFSDKQAAYAVLDARLEYTLGARWRLALKINNVFDHTYYQTIGDPAGGNWYGDPRNYAFTLTGSL